jgi:hypothetical protein
MSSNSIVGEIDQTLTITINPDTLLKASGKVVVQFPEYYTNSGSSNTMVSSTPTCGGINIVYT